MTVQTETAGRHIVDTESTEEIPFETKTWNKILERIQMWSKDRQNPIEWCCVLIGKPKEVDGKNTFAVTDFYELPVFNLSRRQGLSIVLEDVLRIAEKYWVIGLLHTHPDGDLFPSSADFATFLYCDVLMKRSLVYIIASPDGRTEIYTFARCHQCPLNSFFDRFVRKREELDKANGGEKEYGNH